MNAANRVEQSPEGRRHPLHVALPFDLSGPAEQATQDAQLQQFVNRATRQKDTDRAHAFRKQFGDRYDALRTLAGEIKQHTLDHLDYYLEQFAERASAAGAQLHFAKDARQANDICIAIARRSNSKLCVKAKSMVTEETGLVPALERAGVETIETDLGEFILQLDHDAPSHIVTPMIHKDRTATGRAFARELGAEYTDDPSELTAIARRYLREKFRAADLGISGANFLIGQTGSLVICTNEGNGMMCTSGPRVHVALVGIEKLIPACEHLAVFLKLLARSSTAQPLTIYTHVITGPHRPGERDGPHELHIILVDNGRTEILREPTREMLRCIRCGACLNACPVYRKIGGHAYGAVYSGPIGALITPLFKGLSNYPDLPHASSLCGACYEACPVKIDIPRHLVRLRAEMVSRRITGWRERLVFRLWARTLRSPRLYRWTNWVQRKLTRLFAKRSAGRERRDRFADNTWLQRLPGPLRGWTRNRDMPTPTSANFRDWWKRRGKS